jgi:D-amino-acid dehydrogenase
MSIRSSQIVVLGAGMVGVGTALALQARGHQVMLVDRSMPGSETSYGNAGVIQGEACEPYALPRDFATLWGIAWKQDNAVEWNIDGLLRSAPSLLPYWFHSAPKRHQKISQAYSRLTRRATTDHASLIAAADGERLVRRDGYRLVFRGNAAFDLMSRKAEKWKEQFGVRAVVEDSNTLAMGEPALKRRMAGAILWQDAWTCSDPGGLVKAYASLFRERGGDQVQAEARSLEKSSLAGWRIVTDAGQIDTEHVVVALGPWSPQIVEPFGYSIPMIRKRGYHMHFAPSDRSPDLLIIDAEASAVYAPMRAGLRIATGADLSSGKAEAMPKQLRHAHAMASELFDFGEPIETSAWVGTRPCMPDMLPVVGAAPRHAGLWFNFGHGHQGFTLGPTTGELLAGLIEGDAPPEASPLSPSRQALGL